MNINTPKSSLKILSYNIYMRPYFVNGPGGDFKSERLENFLSIINNYDILCLQEMFRSLTHRQDYLIEQSFVRGFKYFAKINCPGIHDQFQVDSGLIILSKIPIVDHCYTIFEHYDTTDGFAKKGILYAKIQLLNKQNLHLFNTHTQASYHHPMTGKDIRQSFSRIEQLKEIQNFVKQKIDHFYRENDLVLLVGDFNINSLQCVYPVDKMLKFFDESSQQKLKKIDFKNEYQIMQVIFQREDHLQFVDIARQINKHKTPTFGKFKVEKFKDKRDYLLGFDLEKLDYMFHVNVLTKNTELQETSEDIIIDQSQQYYSIDYNSFHVDDLQIEDQYYNQMSDHAALSVKLTINQLQQIQF